jgi:hypothetical protein
LVVAAFAIVAALLVGLAQQVCITAGGALFVLALVISILQIYRIGARFIYFVDSVHPKHLAMVRLVRRWRSGQSPRPSYTHTTLGIPEALKKEISQALSRYPTAILRPFEPEDRRSVSIAVAYQGQATALLMELALAFLRNDFYVQYLTASRHPIEFVGHLKAAVTDDDWKRLVERIVTIDAYSSHFAFTDSVYGIKTRELEGLGVDNVTSKMTYAGIHSAASRAFNRIKAKAGGSLRKPTLVIYEGCYALADLESPEQYRIFVRHVLPSERMWDGMFSVFIECAPPATDWQIVNGYASSVLDLRLLSVSPELAASRREPLAKSSVAAAKVVREGVRPTAKREGRSN